MPQTSEMCPLCGRFVVQNRGSHLAPYLVVLDMPTADDISAGRILSGKRADALITELGKWGISSTQLEFTSLWKHEPNYSGTAIVASPCLEKAVIDVLRLMTTKKGVMLMGTECIKWLSDISTAAEVSSLDIRDHILSIEDITKFVIAAPSLNSMFYGALGEHILAFKRFKERMEK